MKRFFIGFALLALIVLPGCGTVTEDGEDAGVITAVEKNGLIWKTWTVYQKSDAAATTADRYCVEDDEIARVLKEASQNKQRVSLKYHDELIVAPWRCNGEEAGIVDGVETLE